MTASQLLIGLFCFIMAAVSAAGYVLVLRPRRVSGDAEIPVPIGLEQRGMPTAQAAVVSMFRIIGEAMPGMSMQSGRLRRQLIAAGFRWPTALSIFLGIKYATAVMFGVAAIVISMANHNETSAFVLPVVCGMAFGYMLPDRVLDKMVRRRLERLRRGLPAALDLLVLAVEAGQGLDAAILDTSRGLRSTHPDLAAEFTQLQLELKTSTTRAESLRNLEARSHDIEIRKFVNLLIDTDRFGTSLGPALKTHARYMRIRFRQIAQERARKVGVKLIFPVFFLIFPSVILVTLGPAVILIFTQMKNLLAQ